MSSPLDVCFTSFSKIFCFTFFPYYKSRDLVGRRYSFWFLVFRFCGFFLFIQHKHLGLVKLNLSHVFFHLYQAILSKCLRSLRFYPISNNCSLHFNGLIYNHLQWSNPTNITNIIKTSFSYPSCIKTLSHLAKSGDFVCPLSLLSTAIYHPTNIKTKF